MESGTPIFFATLRALSRTSLSTFTLITVLLLITVVYTTVAFRQHSYEPKKNPTVGAPRCLQPAVSMCASLVGCDVICRTRSPLPGVGDLQLQRPRVEPERRDGLKTGDQGQDQELGVAVDAELDEPDLHACGAEHKQDDVDDERNGDPDRLKRVVHLRLRDLEHL